MQKSQETNIKCVSLFTLDQVNDFISGYYKWTKNMIIWIIMKVISAKNHQQFNG